MKETLFQQALLDIDRLRAGLAAKERELAAARKALREYGRHRADCEMEAVYNFPAARFCSCGWQELAK